MAIYKLYIVYAILLSNSFITLTLLWYSLILQYIMTNKKASILVQKGLKTLVIARLNANLAL